MPAAEHARESSSAHWTCFPEFFYLELGNYEGEVAEKTGLDQHEFTVLLNLLFEHLRVVPRDEFEAYLDEARPLIGDADPGDVPFLPLALHRDADIWSDDGHFQEQDAVKAWRTHELIDELDRTE